MNYGDIGWAGMDWIKLAQDTDKWRTLVSTANVGNILSSYTTGDYSRKIQLSSKEFYWMTTGVMCNPWEVKTNLMTFIGSYDGSNT
jgi:hypothetical protein